MQVFTGQVFLKKLLFTVERPYAYFTALIGFPKIWILLLLKTDHEFSINKYLDAIIHEFESLGMKVTIREKRKAKSQIDSAFLKSETLWKELVLDDIITQNRLNQTVNIKIKLEVDTAPPLGFETEEKLLLQPFSFYVKYLTLSDLFAGKMHALLFRKWDQNVKGRDWYDMEWYIKKGTAFNLNHFAILAKDSGDWKKDAITEEEFRDLLSQRIDAVNFLFVKNDIKRFIKDQSVLDIWSPKYFHELVTHLKIS